MGEATSVKGSGKYVIHNLITECLCLQIANLMG